VQPWLQHLLNDGHLNHLPSNLSLKLITAVCVVLKLVH
jgi:hypothetical protein